MNDWLLRSTSCTNFVLILVEVEVEFESVVSPRAELKVAALYVEGKVEDVDGTGALEDGGWHPQHHSIPIDDGHCISVLLQALIGAKQAHRRMDDRGRFRSFSSFIICLSITRGDR